MNNVNKTNLTLIRCNNTSVEISKKRELENQLKEIEDEMINIINLIDGNVEISEQGMMD